MNTTVTITASASAITMDSQIPIMPSPPAFSKMKGRRKTVTDWKTSVRKKEMTADTGPLFSAVKKDEPKIAVPVKRKAKEQYKNPVFVISKSDGLYPTNAWDIGTAKERASATMATEEIIMIVMLFLKSPLSSCELPAP